MSLILPRWGLILPRVPPPAHVLYSAVTHTFQEYVHTQKTPPIPPQNTPFPGLNLKVGKMNYLLVNLDPNLAIFLKSGQNVYRSGDIYVFFITVTFTVHARLREFAAAGV